MVQNKSVIGIVVGLALGASLAIKPFPAGASGAVTPDVVERFIQPGQTSSAQFQVKLVAGQPTYDPVDIIFIFDGTSSMTSLIQDFQQNIDKTLSRIGGRATDVRYAVAQFGDYTDNPECKGKKEPSKSVWRLLSDFTSDTAATKRAVFSTGIFWNGCDGPEAYLRALLEAQMLNWRPTSKRYVIMVGDALAHLNDRGLDNVLGTADDVTIGSIVGAYKKANISILGIYAISKDRVYRAQVKAAFESYSAPTGGMAISLSQGKAVGDAIIEGILKTVAPPPAPVLKIASPSLASWVGPQERRQHDSAGLDYRFDLPLLVPPGTKGGIYKVDLRAHGGQNGNGPIIGGGQIIIRVGWLFLPIKAVAIWLIPILCLLLATIWLLRRLRSPSRSLEFRGIALFETLGTLLGLALIVASGMTAYCFVPADLNSVASAIDFALENVPAVKAK